MARHPRYIVFAPPGKLQDVADALNRPRSFSEDYPDDGSNELGLGPRTCRTDASTCSGLDPEPAGPPQDRGFTLSVRPDDVDRLESILDSIGGVNYDTWHPDKADGSEWSHPREFWRSHDLERLPEQPQ